jgi:hypothetical protein
MDWIALVTLFSSLATMVGVFLAGYQIKKTSDLHRTQFEDSLAKEYRDLIQKIPLKALLGEDLSEKEYKDAKPYLFQYVNLTNDQIFLRSKNRISLEVWNDWQGGIKYNLSLPAFRKLWEEIKSKMESFKELRLLEEKEFKTDPQIWDKEEIKELKP